MISWLCGRRSIGKRRRWRSGDPVQPVAICGVSDEVNQVSKTSASPVKPPGWSRCASAYPGGACGHRVDRQRRLVRDDRGREVGGSVRLHRVPHREGHAEVALPADAPVEVQVLRPVAEAQAHEVRVPGDPLPRLHERLLVLEDPHEPLPGGDELEGTIALLEELHRVLERLRLRDERGEPLARGAPGRVAQQLHHGLLRLLDGPAGEVRVRLVRLRGVEAREELAPELHGERGARRGPPPGAGRGPARATTARRSRRRTCRPSGCPCPSRGPRARSGRWAPARGRRASPPASRRAAGSARRRGARPPPRRPEAARGASWRRRSCRRPRPRSARGGRRPSAAGPRPRPAPPRS